MKKTLLLALVSLSFLFIFSSCGEPGECRHTYSEWKYDEANHQRDYTCSCELDAEAEPHSFDSDGRCSECGFETFKSYQLTVIDEGHWLIYDRNDVYEEFDIIKFHTFVHPIKIDMYVDGEYYSSGRQVSINENADYIEYSFTMPAKAVTVEFKSELVSYSSILMLHPWLGRVWYNDIKTLVIEKGFLGVAPENEPEIITYIYKNKISSIKSALMDISLCEVRADSEIAAPIEGGSYIKYTFETEDETYSIYIENRRIETDGKIYLIYDEYPIN